MSDFSLSVREEGNTVIIETAGYLNNVGGEKVSEACYEKMDDGKKHFLLDLENSKVVNSIGVSNTIIWHPLLKKHLILWVLQNILLYTTLKQKGWKAWHKRLIFCG